MCRISGRSLSIIFVSSVRPMTDPSSEHYKNQLAAWRSWHAVAEAIIFFNDYQEALDSEITRFIPSENYPRILHMAEFMMEQEGWCALLNSDIVITPYFKTVEKKLNDKKAMACSSWRHEFDPAVGIEPRTRVDNGLDFFAAKPWVWAHVYAQVNENLRLGSVRWDTWMLGFFSIRAAAGNYDITKSRCVCHPRHSQEGRKYGPPPPDDLHFHAWPVMSRMEIK